MGSGVFGWSLLMARWIDSKLMHCFLYIFRTVQDIVNIRPRKACSYPDLRSFGWVSYDKVGVLYSGKLGSRSEARASDLRSYPGLWWKRIKLYIYEGNESEYSPRTCSIGRPAGGTLCPHLYLYKTYIQSKTRQSRAGLGRVVR